MSPDMLRASNDESDERRKKRKRERKSSTSSSSSSDSSSSSSSDEIVKSKKNRKENKSVKRLRHDHLLHNSASSDVEEIVKHSGVYIKTEAKRLIKQHCCSHSAAARNFMAAVLTPKAITECSIMGKLAKSPLGKPVQQREGLFRPALNAIRPMDDFVDLGILAMLNVMLEIGEMELEETLKTFFWEKVTVDVNEYLRFSDPTFKRHFRLSTTQFEILCHELVELLSANNEIVRVGRDFRHKVLMVTWILATPDTFRSVALRFGVHPGEVHRYYKKIVPAICDLGRRYIFWPDAVERGRISAELQEVSGLQGVVGMLDSKHFVMTSPELEPASFRNRHHDYSINAMVVCDNDLKVRDLYVGEAGSLHDARVFRRSPLCRNILFTENFMSRGEYIIGDSAYMLLDRVITPFQNNGHLTPRQIQFNRVLSGIRVRIEHTFGRVTNIWRRSRNMFVYKMDYMVDHICASFVLHNFRLYHGDEYPLVNVDGDHPDFDDFIPDNVNDDDNLGEDEVGGILDPHSLQEEGEALLRNAQLRGEQRRWNLCNSL
ncbi:Putative nuclease [Frankliniella fusca]|uniref:Nuclease n=1 Tax=Frankliniella fusca TaxID=407009 RepID=A0AAE1HXK0_9NEOP|nr:Putative nuclease [Frankliniella fusca]